ncbi:MAG: hypothetical protein ACT4P7_06945 [Gemmatimonadaceae bacterium]
MKGRPTLLVVLAAALIGCGTSQPSAPTDLAGPNVASNALTITTSKTTYGWDEVSFGGLGVVATVVNPNGRDYFANVGDAFNGAMEQSPLFIALGTDAAIERLEDGGTWSAMPTGILVEGSKVVVLRAGRGYELRGNLSEPRRVGTMRVRLRYYTTASSAGQQAMVDYSAPFTVR